MTNDEKTREEQQSDESVSEPAAGTPEEAVISMVGQTEDEESEGPGPETPDVIPVLPLKDTVVFPETMMPLAVGQPRSVRLIDDVLGRDKLVGLVAGQERGRRSCPARTTSTTWARWPPSRR